jgi:hypothetical protein
MKTKRNKLYVLLAFTGVVALSCMLWAGQDPVPGIAKSSPVLCKCGGCKCNLSPSNDLKTAMRKLWEEHITWTRNVIFCIMDDLPGGSEATTRLLKNQDDIGDAIKPYYGDEAGKKLTDLLHTHITTAAEVVQAAKKDDKKALDDANKRWFDNSDEISAFLSKANPNWKLDDMKRMMHDHLKFTTEEAMARKNKKYSEDVKAFDKVHEEILRMSDMLSDGIVKQFPDKFSASMGMNDK